MAIEYKCDVCWAEFETTQPHDAECPCCGEPVKRQWCEYTDREGGFWLGGKVEVIE